MTLAKGERFDDYLSTAFMTAQNGVIQNHYRYDAFGNLLESEERLFNRIRYTGQQYDQATEQYYLRARYYTPALGRFLQEDIYQGDGLNLYAYCGNNPVVYCDPSGYKKAGDGCPPQGKMGDGSGDEEHITNGLKLSDTQETGETSVSSRRAAAEQKLEKAAQGSQAEGILIGKDGDVPVYQSQKQLVESIESAGAKFVGTMRNGDGQIYHMDTPYGPVEIRVMQEKPGQTNPYLDNRTVIVEQGSVGQGTGTYTYGNGAKITGPVSKCERKAIGHTHGQTP